ncbi:putative E3 ubiquitin-protein ligase [Dispira parvispora]|uniref:HECT-type E3 ubiquitin transferase n=1 Tax=Dispira parvispora TaxID=1520584 RepID=A0A9W8B023_9FUNG|nr:putative E3 ubiquitin-protein ligase [Dispira parvispora]
MNRTSITLQRVPRWLRYSVGDNCQTIRTEPEEPSTPTTESDQAIGTCMCCDSKLRYPQASSCFRCTVCDTINDLIEYDETASESRRRRPLTLDRLRSAIHAVRKSKLSVMQLERLISETFSQWDRLNNSFSDGLRTSTDHPGVALDDVREAYRLLLGLSPGCVRTLMGATERLLKRPCRRLRRKDDLRFLLIILENPLLGQHNFPQETEYHHQIIKRLLGILSCLDNSLHNYLVHWFSRLAMPLFRARVELVNHFITFRLAKYRKRHPSPSAWTNIPYESDWSFKSAARVMSLLFAANNMSRERIPISEFYNSMVDFVDLPADYDAWQQRTAKFAFCQYPSLISMSAKLRIMRLDARRQMESKVKEALLTTILKKRLIEPYLTLNVRRDCIVEDSLNQLASHETDLKKKLRVQFIGEAGIDAGGLTKEWFMLLLRDLFNPLNGMFTLDEESQMFWFNPASFETSDQYFLVGVIFGLAIYNSTILDVHFPLACYKKLLDCKVGLRDLTELRPSLGRGLRQLLDYHGDDVEDIFGLTFAIDRETFGQQRTVPLVPNGENIPVTRANRAKYVSRYIHYTLNESIARQFDPFRRGFYFVCGGNALSLFQPREIEVLVRGSSECIHIDQLKSVTEYQGFHPEEPIIQYLWDLLASWDSGQQKKFLAFVTGCDRIPALGTCEMMFKIVRLGGDCERFPIAHTCFNQLGLFEYSSPQKLKEKLTRAIHESEGFWLK